MGTKANTTEILTLALVVLPHKSSILRLQSRPTKTLMVTGAELGALPNQRDQPLPLFHNAESILDGTPNPPCLNTRDHLAVQSSSART